jgi:hypothetical protein
MSLENPPYKEKTKGNGGWSKDNPPSKLSPRRSACGSLLRRGKSVRMQGDVTASAVVAAV